MNSEKMALGLLAANSAEGVQTREALLRLKRLNAEIAALEGSYEVRYRPERPEFDAIVSDAERLANSILQPSE
jgi:hypothetical protein